MERALRRAPTWKLDLLRCKIRDVRGIEKVTKYKVVLQYVGTCYSGWQIQKNQHTIQGKLNSALHQLTGEEISVVGAGRTDSGVHAMEQVAHLRLSEKIATEKLLRGLNGILPWDIRVMRIDPAPHNFHAQKDALKKRYEYRIYTGPILPPFLHGYVHHMTRPLNAPDMQRAAEQLCRSDDFRGFAAASTRVKSTVRTVFLSQIQEQGCHLTYQIEGDGFLHHMVRNIVGTLLEVGVGKRAPDHICKILNSKDRRLAGPTAPAHGLYLMHVWY